jgi:hypothetical protein
VKVIKGDEKDKLSVKEIITKYNSGKTQVYDTLKAKSGIRNHWQNCGDSMNEILRKTGKENTNEIVWEWFVNARGRNFRILYMEQ